MPRSGLTTPCRGDATTGLPRSQAISPPIPQRSLPVQAEYPQAGRRARRNAQRECGALAGFGQRERHSGAWVRGGVVVSGTGCGSSGGTVRCVMGDRRPMPCWMDMKRTLGHVWHGSSGACCSGLCTGRSWWGSSHFHTLICMYQ